MAERALASDGAQLPLAQLETTFTYADGFITTITVEYQGNNYRQTFTNDGTNITHISRWILL